MGTVFTAAILKHYLVALVLFLAIDMAWLGIIAKRLYDRYLGYLMASSFNMVAAMIFYLIFIAGLLVFVIEPALLKGSLQHALLLGMFFGFVTYATYDLTNLATVKDWPLAITLIDLAWGTALGGMTSLGSVALIRFLGW